MMKPMIRWHRRKGYRFQDMDLVILTTIGAKSGQTRENPVAWTADGDDAWLVVASSAGSRHNPAWYHNIAAHPDQVWAEFPDRRLRVVPEQLHGERRAEAWQRLTQSVPRYLGYMEKTDRELPVIRLTSAPEKPERAGPDALEGGAAE
jgi:deazaflavin-dependent oxidoreductase (nitroreductase family)